MNKEFRKRLLDINEKIKNLNYDEYSVHLKEFKEFLKEELKKDPDNTRLISLLASAQLELREGEEASITLLKEHLTRVNTLSDDDKLRLYINIAFYYFSDYNRKEEFKYLNLALNFDKNNSVVHYALGLYYYDENNYEKAEECFFKASEKEKNFRNLFSYGVLLYKNKKYKKSKEIFKELSSFYPDKQVVRLYLGYAELKLENNENALIIADQLMKEELIYDDLFGDCISYDEIGMIYYELFEYEKFSEIFKDKKKYPYHIGNRFDYFYSLYQLNKIERFNKLVKKERKELEMYLQEVRDEKITEGFCYAEKQEDILYAEQEIKQFKEEIDKIKKGIKPEPFFYIHPIYDCYLVDCIRHGKSN